MTTEDPNQLALFTYDDNGQIITTPSEVRFKNTFTTISTKGLNAADTDIFNGLLSLIKNSDNNSLNISFDDFFNFINRNSTRRKYRPARFKNILREITRKISKIQLSLETGVNDKNEKTYGFAPIFQVLLVNESKKTIQASLSPQFQYLFSDFGSGNFTEYLLPEVLDLKGVYAKKLIPLLKEWKSVGKAVVPIDKLRTSLGIKSTYRMTNIYQKILDPAVKELRTKQRYRTLSYTKDKKPGHGNRIVSVTFTFEPETSIKDQKIIQGASPDSPDAKGIYPLEGLINRQAINRQSYNEIVSSYSHHWVKASRKGDTALENLIKEEQNAFRLKYGPQYEKHFNPDRL